LNHNEIIFISHSLIAIDVEGLFRISGQANKVEDLASGFFQSNMALVGGINPDTDPHVVAELLKKVMFRLFEENILMIVFIFRFSF